MKTMPHSLPTSGTVGQKAKCIQTRLHVQCAASQRCVGFHFLRPALDKTKTKHRDISISRETRQLNLAGTHCRALRLACHPIVAALQGTFTVSLNALPALSLTVFAAAVAISAKAGIGCYSVNECCLFMSRPRSENRTSTLPILRKEIVRNVNGSRKYVVDHKSL